MVRRCSSGSKSDTVEPSSTLPTRGIALAANTKASGNDVLPAPPCPTRATLRILTLGYVFTQGPPEVGVAGRARILRSGEREPPGDRYLFGTVESRSRTR